MTNKVINVPSIRLHFQNKQPQKCACAILDIRADLICAMKMKIYVENV